jgi:type IV secretion system protein VirB6
MAIARGAGSTGRAAYNSGRALHNRVRSGSTSDSSGAKAAMQTKITQNSTPA